MKWLTAHGTTLDREMYAWSAYTHSYHEGLVYINSIGPWNQGIFAEMMYYPKTAETIKWLHSEFGVPLTFRCWGIAASQGDFEFLEWLKERDAPLDNDDAAIAAAENGQLAMLQYFDSINTEPWSELALDFILVAAVNSGSMPTCEWIDTRFNATTIATHMQHMIFSHITLEAAEFAVKIGVTWHQLANKQPGTDLKCADLRDCLSCEAFHWAHEQRQQCTCHVDD